MAADFISLADYLHRRRMPPNAASSAGELVLSPATGELVPSPATAHDIEPQTGIAVGADAASPEAAARGPIASDIIAALHDARVFRARLADAFDDAAARLLRELAADVLVRELRLAPCDIENLVTRVRERAPVVRVRVAPDEVARVHGVPVVGDDVLASGDAIVELAGGALDARFGVRLAAVLEAFA